MICIESAIEEKFPGLTIRKPLVGKSLIKFLRFICHEREFKQFEQSYPKLEGFDFLEQALNYFDFSYRVKDTHRERIPSHGRIVIVANHPIGSLDGLALLRMVSEIRRDVRVVANELLYTIKPLRSLLLPVDNMSHQSGKQQLRAINNHLNNEGALIIFPAGEVSRISATGIKDARWNPGFLRFATKTQSPILPMFVDGRNSWFFYSLSLVAKPISTLWLIREMFKHAKSHVDIFVGDPIEPDQYQNFGVTPPVVAKLFRKHVYRLSKKNSYTNNPSKNFNKLSGHNKPNHKKNSQKTQKKNISFGVEYEAVAHPENRQLLRKEIQECQKLGETNDGKCIYLYRYSTNSVVIRELGRLRELAFRYVKEGTGKRRDVDQYDSFYDHIILWDDKELEVIGAYRMAQTTTTAKATMTDFVNQPTLYTQTLFEFDEKFKPIFESGLELGRSFIQPRYWGKRSLDYLWQGIGAYLNANPHIRYLFGPVSISYGYSADLKDLLIHYYREQYGQTDCSEIKVEYSNLENGICKNASDNNNKSNNNKRKIKKVTLARAVTPYQPLEKNIYVDSLSKIRGKAEKFQLLKATMKENGFSVPTLYKQYTELCQDNGCQFLAFNVDKDFADCVDGLVLVDLEKVKPEKRKRYLEAFVV